MVFYAVIDTNVVVSSLLKRDSIPAKILDLVISGIIVPLFNEEILSEYAEVLSRKEFGFSICFVMFFSFIYASFDFFHHHFVVLSIENLYILSIYVNISFTLQQF